VFVGIKWRMNISTNNIKKQFRIISLTLSMLFAWVNALRAEDTLRVLSEEQFLNIVRTHHPVAKQGSLLVDLARANLTAMRGAFDPVFFLNNDQKTFDGKNYFNYNQSGLVIPTWFGVELYAGLENNFGDLISSEVTSVPSSYAGASIPLLRDLVLDKRRASLQQAKLFRTQSAFERRVVINDLLLDAYFTYWNWCRDYQVYRVIRNTVAINTDRYELVKIAFQQGDRAAIDTTEALAQLQSFQQQQAEAWLKFRKSSLELSNFLWLPNETPAYISESIVPDTGWAAMKMQQQTLNVLDEWIANTLSNHPKLQSLDLKINALEVERRLKFQSLLPRADLKYNFLQQGYQPWRGVNWAFMENNFKFGFNLAVPIPNRRGIGEYKAAKIKLQTVDLDRDLTRLNLENKVRYHYNEVLNLQQQIRIFEDAYANYIKLLEAEQLRFGLGETTLFVLNIRENKALETNQKLLELKAKFYQAFASLNWASGQLQ